MPSTAELRDLLASTTEVSTFVSVLTVLAGLLVMLVFLFRLIYQDLADGGGAGVTKVSTRPAQILLAPVKVPFTLRLLVDKVVVSASVAHTVRCYRGVSVAAAHRTARSARLPAALHQSQLFGPGGATVEGELRRAGPHLERELEIPGDAGAGLGPPPRDRYPLVVVLSTEGGGPEGGVTACLTILHLADPACPAPSHVLFTFIRRGPALTRLHPLYIEAAEEVESSDTESCGGEEWGGVEDRARCIICQVERVNRVALPCRHANSCGRCFDRLEARCPMCRGFITAFFLLSPDPPAEPISAPAPPPTTPLPRLSRLWHSWNLWYNAAMGLREN